MKKVLYYTGLLFIAVWLFTLHTSFAFSLNPLTGNEFFKDLFVVNGYDFKRWIPYFWGASFSIAITAIIANLQKGDKYFWHFATTVALLELIGIALFNTPEHFKIWAKIAAIYYGIYGFFMTLFYFYVKSEKTEIATKLQQNATMKLQNEINNFNTIDQQVINLLKPDNEGNVLRQNAIAEMLNIDPSKVTRIKQRYELSRKNVTSEI